MVRLTYRPDMTIAVDWEVKHQTKQTNNNGAKQYEGHPIKNETFFIITKSVCVFS